MCGIAGSINNPLDETRILRSLHHRGPDESGSYRRANVELYQTRLSIQDIKGGHQPLFGFNKALVFNGEIYNHLELRNRLLGNERFDTASDTQTLLYLLHRYGIEVLEEVDGMFAFALYDMESGTLMLGRDRAGKKPLFIYRKDKKLLFASELNTLKTALKGLEVDTQALEFYTRAGLFYPGSTPYRDIRELGQGEIWHLDTATLECKKERFFSMMEVYQSPGIVHNARELVTHALERSVEDRLLSSDLEVGAFLSGGIDSSLICAFASRHRQDLKTFTVSFEGAYDEAPLAALVAKKYETDHREIRISMDVKNDIEKIVRNYGKPFMDSSAIPSYYVSKAAKEHVSVILNGDGADELFGGYRRYVPVVNSWLKIARVFAPLQKILPKPHEKKSLYNFGYRLLSMARKRGLARYLSMSMDIFEDEYSFGKNSYADAAARFIEEVESSSLSPLAKALYLDYSIILFSDLLVKMDIATMANSLEGRSPFLSKYMLELAPRLEDGEKIKGGRTKSILRDIAQEYLPKELISQPKRGFEVPLKSWMDNELKEITHAYLSAPKIADSFVDKGFINRLLEAKTDIAKEKRAKMLYTLLCLEIWQRGGGA